MNLAGQSGDAGSGHLLFANFNQDNTFRCPSPVILEDRRALYSKEALKLNRDQKKEGQSGPVAPTLREDS